MDTHKRLKSLRENLNLTTRAFGAAINMSGGAITNMEKGNRNITERTIRDICQEFNVNESWLHNGTGDMFKVLPEEDETAAVVSDLLEETNPFYDAIVEILKVYSQLDPKSQDTINNFCKKITLSLQTKKED